MIDLTHYKKTITNINPMSEVGKVIKIIRLVIEAEGPSSSIGDLCYIYLSSENPPISAEVVGFRENKILLMPLGDMEGLKPGSIVINAGSPIKVQVGITFRPCS